MRRKTISKEVRIEYFKSSGPGGQHKNKAETAVRLRHLATGIEVVAQKERSRQRNLDIAWERLNEKLEELNRPQIPRIPTRTPRSVREKRLEKKKRHSEKKSLRRKPILG